MLLPLLLLLWIETSNSDAVDRTGGNQFWRNRNSDISQRDLIPFVPSVDPPLYPPGRIDHVFTSIEGSTDLLLFGGRSSRSSYFPLDDTWLYRIPTSEWINVNVTYGPSTLTHMPSPRFSASATSIRTGLVGLYGGTSDLTYTGANSEVWFFDARTSDDEDTGTDTSTNTADLPCWVEVDIHSGIPDWHEQWGTSIWPMKQGEGFYTSFGYDGFLCDKGDINVFMLIDSSSLDTQTGQKCHKKMSGLWLYYPDTLLLLSERAFAQNWVDYSSKNEKLWVFGGRDDSMQVLSDLNFYDVSKLQWEVVIDNGIAADGTYVGGGARPGTRMFGGVVSGLGRVAFMFGGIGRDASAGEGLLGDLWLFNMDLASLGTNEGWTFIQLQITDSNDADTVTPEWENMALMTPGQRSNWNNIALVENSLWFFGGQRVDAADPFYGGADLWSLNLTIPGLEANVTSTGEAVTFALKSTDPSVTGCTIQTFGPLYHDEKCVLWYGNGTRLSFDDGNGDVWTSDPITEAELLQTCKDQPWFDIVPVASAEEIWTGTEALWVVWCNDSWIQGIRPRFSRSLLADGKGTFTADTYTAVEEDPLSASNAPSLAYQLIQVEVYVVSNTSSSRLEPNTAVKGASHVRVVVDRPEEYYQSTYVLTGIYLLSSETGLRVPDIEDEDDDFDSLSYVGCPEMVAGESRLDDCVLGMGESDPLEVHFTAPYVGKHAKATLHNKNILRRDWGQIDQLVLEFDVDPNPSARRFAMPTTSFSVRYSMEFSLEEDPLSMTPQSFTILIASLVGGILGGCMIISTVFVLFWLLVVAARGGFKNTDESTASPGEKE